MRYLSRPDTRLPAAHGARQFVRLPHSTRFRQNGIGRFDLHHVSTPAPDETGWGSTPPISRRIRQDLNPQRAAPHPESRNCAGHHLPGAGQDGVRASRVPKRRHATGYSGRSPASSLSADLNIFRERAHRIRTIGQRAFTNDASFSSACETRLIRVYRESLQAPTAAKYCEFKLRSDMIELARDRTPPLDCQTPTN